MKRTPTSLFLPLTFLSSLSLIYLFIFSPSSSTINAACNLQQTSCDAQMTCVLILVCSLSRSCSVSGKQIHQSNIRLVCLSSPRSLAELRILVPEFASKSGKAMASHATQRPLIIQNENLDFHNKKIRFDGNAKSSKTAAKKCRVALGNRKALHDITNKPFADHEAPLQKKNLPKEEFNVAGEMFLHDHRKCIKEQQAARNTFCLDLVLPRYDSISITDAKIKQAKGDPYSLNCYPEPAEVPMSEFSDMLEPSTRWASPPSSPTCWDSPPSSPFAWQFGEEVEFVLKQEDSV